MPRERTLARLDRLVWILVYGGLFALVIGLATGRSEPALGWPLTIGGAVVALAGFILIFVRARLGASAPGAPSNRNRSPAP